MPSLVEIGPVVLEKKIFKSCQFIFINSRLSQKFFKGGVEEENFERIMFVDTCLNACTHKN